MEEFDVELQPRARPQAHSPLMIRCLRRSPICREYVLVGRKIPSCPNTQSIEGADVTTDFVDGKFIVTVSNADQWGRINQAIADAVAVAAGGARAMPK